MTNTGNNTVGEQPRAASLMDDLGLVLSNSGCELSECIEALTGVLGDAMAQATDRRFSKKALSATMLFVTEAYSLGCAGGDTTSTMQ